MPPICSVPWQRVFPQEKPLTHSAGKQVWNTEILTVITVEMSTLTYLSNIKLLIREVPLSWGLNSVSEGEQAAIYTRGKAGKTVELPITWCVSLKPGTKTGGHSPIGSFSHNTRKNNLTQIQISQPPRCSQAQLGNFGWEGMTGLAWQSLENCYILNSYLQDWFLSWLITKTKAGWTSRKSQEFC